jgi:hypothetical protein
MANPGLARAAVGRDAAERAARRVEAATHEPLFTNYGADFCGTLDYLFYTANSLQPTALLELPDKSDVQVRGGGTCIPVCVRESKVLAEKLTVVARLQQELPAP